MPFTLNHLECRAIAPRDSARREGFDYTRSTDIELKPRQNFVVDFRAEAGGFSFH